MILLLVAGVSLLLWCLRAMAYLTVSFRMTLVLCLHMLTCNFAPPPPWGDAVSFSRHPSFHLSMPSSAITFILTLLLNSQHWVSLSPFSALLLTLLSFPCGSAGKESACSVGDLGSILGLGRSPGEGEGSPLQ